MSLEIIENKFGEYLTSGFIQMICSNSDIYPPMNSTITKRTFNDTIERVRWRAKQVMDFAFLFSYIQSLSEYHIIVDDDVVVVSQYITAIRTYVEMQSKSNPNWVALHFSHFVAIGLLFHSADLPKLAQFLIMFHQDQPVDMLIEKYIKIEVRYSIIM